MESRHQFTGKIAAAMGYSADIIQAIESKSIVQVAKRPMNSCLNCEKLQNELNYRLLTVDESLAAMRSQGAIFVTLYGLYSSPNGFISSKCLTSSGVVGILGEPI
jgi:hypothetical protein